MIDTPLGRISGKPRVRYANLINNHMKENQLIITPTDTEFRDVKAILKDRLNTINEIVYDEDKSECSLQQ